MLVLSAMFAVAATYSDVISVFHTATVVVQLPDYRSATNCHDMRQARTYHATCK